MLEGLRGEESLAALCRREGLAPNLYYRWSKEFLEAGKKRLLGDTTREATSTEVQDLRREHSQLKQVVAEAVLENRVLKKIWWSPVRGTIRATDRGREARDHPGLWRARICRCARTLRELGTQRNVFDVTSDGQRFLVNTVVEGALAAPITWVLDWVTELEQ